MIENTDPEHGTSVLTLINLIHIFSFRKHSLSCAQPAEKRPARIRGLVLV